MSKSMWTIHDFENKLNADRDQRAYEEYMTELIVSTAQTLATMCSYTSATCDHYSVFLMLG